VKSSCPGYLQFLSGVARAVRGCTRVPHAKRMDVLRGARCLNGLGARNKAEGADEPQRPYRGAKVLCSHTQSPCAHLRTGLQMLFSLKTSVVYHSRYCPYSSPVLSVCGTTTTTLFGPTSAKTQGLFSPFCRHTAWNPPPSGSAYKDEISHMPAPQRRRAGSNWASIRVPTPPHTRRWGRSASDPPPTSRTARKPYRLL
jgi:hypothetical protein